MKKAFALTAVAGLASVAAAQPVITLDVTENSGTPNDNVVNQGSTITVTIGLDTPGFDFDPNVTGLPASAPLLYRIDAVFSGGGEVDLGSGVNEQPSTVDPDGAFGPLPANDTFTLNNPSADPLIGRGSAASILNGQFADERQAYTEGALFSFDFVIDSDFLGDITISIGDLTAESGSLFGDDVLDYGTGDGTPGSEASFGNADRSATAVVTVVPTPGAAAILGLGGLVAARRRRA